MELAQAAEATDKNARELETVGVRVNAVSPAGEGGAHRTSTTIPCYRWGGRHPADKCRFKESDCHHCGKKGHLAKVCRSRKRENAAKISHNQTARAKTRTRSQTAHHVVEETESDQTARAKTRTRSQTAHHVVEETESEAAYTLFNLPGQQASPLMVMVEVNKVKLRMEVDTGASASIISEETYNRSWSDEEQPRLTPSTRKLRTYTREYLKVQG